MDRETIRNNDIRNIIYPNDASQSMSSESILTGHHEVTFFDYFYQHIQRSYGQSSLNISLATNTFSEGLPIKSENMKDSLSCKADQDMILIDSTDTEGMSNSRKEHVPANKNLELKDDGTSSVDLLETRTNQGSKPADTRNDLQSDVVVSENVSLRVVNQGIGDTPNQKHFTEPIYEKLGGGNDLSPDMSLSFSNLRKERSENINEIIGLPPKAKNMQDPLSGKTDEDINLIDFTDTEDLNLDVSEMSNSRKEYVAESTYLEFKGDEAKSAHLLEPRTDKDLKPADTTNDLKSDVVLSENVSLFQKTVTTDNNLLGDLVGQDFTEANFDPFSTIQTDTEKQLDYLKNPINVPAATVFPLLLEYESPPNDKQQPLGDDSSTKQKSREIVTGNKEEGDDSEKETMQPENHEIEIANKLEGSNNKNKGDMKTKEELAYNKYCISPISNRALTTSLQDTNLVHDSQTLKTGTEQYPRIKYIDRNVPRTYKVALKQMEGNSNNLNSQVNKQVHGAIGKEVKQSIVKYPSRRMTIEASWKPNGKEHPKPQKKVSDDNKSHVLTLDLNQENINVGKINSKICNKPQQKSLYSKKIMNKELNKRSCKPITLVSDIEEKIQEGSSKNKLFSNTQNDLNPRTPIIGSCSKCIKLSPLEIARRNRINRNITASSESVLDLRQNLRRFRSASKSVERTKRNQSLPRTTRKRPNKKVSFIENEKIFSYDPNKSVAENFSRTVTAKIKKGESAVGKEQFLVAENCKKLDGTSNENFRGAEGYINPCFEDVPLFDCLPDCEIEPPIANVTNFGEDDLLLTSSPTTQDQKLSQKLSAVSRKSEGNLRRWMKYGVVVRKKMRSMMRERK